MAERSQRFNDTCGVRGYMTKAGPTGAHLHPDRCVGQKGTVRGRDDS